MIKKEDTNILDTEQVINEPQQNTDNNTQHTPDTIIETPIITPANDLDTGIQIPEITDISEISEIVQPPIDKEMCSMIYEILFGMASSVINKDSDITLPPARLKSQGVLLERLFEKYNFKNDNLDAVMFLTGCVMDYKLIKDSKGSE